MSVPMRFGFGVQPDKEGLFVLFRYGQKIEAYHSAEAAANAAFLIMEGEFAGMQVLTKVALAYNDCLNEFVDTKGGEFCCQEYATAFYDACAEYRKASEVRP
jgi:hypothetical protein